MPALSQLGDVKLEDSMFGGVVESFLGHYTCWGTTDLRHNTKQLLCATVKALAAENFEFELLYENVNLRKNKHAAELLGTSNLSIKIVCSPPKSRDTVPLKYHIKTKIKINLQRNY